MCFPILLVLCNLVLFSLAMQKLFILMRSHLFILSFMYLALGDMSARMLLCGMSEISASLAIREMQIKTTMRYHLTPVRVANIKNPQTNVGEDEEKREP